MGSPIDWLVKIAPQSSAAWEATGTQEFRGKTSIETGNSVYEFLDGLFVKRRAKGTGAIEPARVAGVRLIGFVADEGGFWSLSTRWRRGACAVLWMSKAFDAGAFLVTSRTLAYENLPPAPPARTSASRIRRRTQGRGPVLTRTSPSSMTRIHPGVGDRDPPGH